MQIKYLKDAPLGATGDMQEIPDDQANILITLGFAEKVVDKPKRPKSKSDKADKAAELELS